MGAGRELRAAWGGRCGFLGREAEVSDQPQLSHWSIVKAWTSYHSHLGLSQSLQSRDGNLMMCQVPHPLSNSAVVCDDGSEILDSPGQPGISP